jgi:hypothetical protein
VDAYAVQLERERLGANSEQRRAVASVQAQQAAEHAAAEARAAAAVAAADPGSRTAGAASLRSFQGEDLSFVDRKRAQQSQQAGWNADAAAANAALAEARRAEAAAAHATMQAQTAYGANSFAAQQAARAQAAAATSASNLALAAEKRDKDAAAAAERVATKMVALVVDDGPNAGAPRTEFRGYTQQQLGGVLDGQEAQRCVRAQACARRRLAVESRNATWR